MWYKASAPGSVMLLGEYAVLAGYPALVCAINRRMTVRLIPRQDRSIRVHSVLGEYQTEIDQLTIQPPFQFVLATLLAYQSKLVTGCDIEIESQFSHQIGLASSAAVTVSTLAALNQWCGLGLVGDIFIQQARSIVRNVQGRGSGADVAASVLGGMVAYQTVPFQAEKLLSLYPISLLFSGEKTATPVAINYVKDRFARDQATLKTIYQEMGTLSEEGIHSVRQSDWKTLGSVMKLQQILLEKLGVATPVIKNLLADLNQNSDIWGAKISGSGLGDCVIGLGLMKDKRRLMVDMTNEGVTHEKA